MPLHVESKSNEVFGDGMGDYYRFMVHDLRLMIKKMLKAIWQFCSYLFVPRRGQRSEI